MDEDSSDDAHSDPQSAEGQREGGDDDAEFEMDSEPESPPVRAPGFAAKQKARGGRRLDLPDNLDADLYGLRRSVSRARARLAFGCSRLRLTFGCMALGTRFACSIQGELLGYRMEWVRGLKLTSPQQQYDEDPSSDEDSRGPSRARKGKGRAGTCRSTITYIFLPSPR